jgi:DNA-binding protein Fis
MISRDASGTREEARLPLDDLSIAAMEQRLIALVLERTRGHKGKAAQILGINRSTLYNKLREYGIAQN